MMASIRHHANAVPLKKTLPRLRMVKLILIRYSRSRKSAASP